jgi:phosphoglycerate dehydrogenase-like enzyme/sugar (pentulose or hexulose) kinase/ribulose-5-phosphate 4-epimerase/fuculose-1-phosphate aldolase
MNKPWLMGIDLGGSGVRCTLVDSASGHCIENAIPWKPTAVDATANSNLDLDQLWEAAGRASHGALEQAGVSGGQVSGVAISAIRFSTVVIDRQGTSLMSVSNTDAQAVGEYFEVAAKWGDALLGTTGSPALPMHASARLLWLRNQSSDILESIACVYGFGEWLAERLSGVRAISPSQGSATGLLNLGNHEWAWEIIDDMGFPRDIFPPVVESGSRLGKLNAEGAAHLGLSTNTTLAMGGADTQCSLLGGGVTEAGQTAFITGTTAPVEVVLDTPTIDPTGAMVGAHHVVPGRWVLESNGGPMGLSISAFARSLYEQSPEPEAHLFAEAALSEPGAAGVLSTLGAEVMDMSAPAPSMGNLSMSHMSFTDEPAPRKHLARAVAEGCACALEANVQQLESALPAGILQRDTLTLCGGLSRSEVFAQLVADITQSEVAVPHSTQTSALGAAICAAPGAGIYPDIAAAKELGEGRQKYAPNPGLKGVYQSLLQNWSRLREGAQQSTNPPAIDHLLPRILEEKSTSGGESHAPAAEMPRTLVSASFGEDALATLQTKMDVEYASFREAQRLLTGPDLVEALAGRQVFVTEVDVVDAQALKALPDLRVVAACRGDAVNVDIEACTAFGIPVLYAPGRNAIAVADLTVGFMISLARKLPQATRFLAEEDCSAGNMGKMGQAFNQLQGTELWGKTVGLIGFGAVGRAVAKRLAGFEVNVLIADPFVTSGQATLAGCQLVDLDTLLTTSDFVSLHAAVTSETAAMLGTVQFAQMKQGAFFINTARAALIDEQALIDAVESGHIAGAALDAFAVEPPGFDHPLVQHPNVISTPHSAGNTKEVADHQGDTITKALLQLMRGERPGNVLNPVTLDTFSWSGARPLPAEDELQQLMRKSAPAVTDLQRDASALKPQRPDTSAIQAPAQVIDQMHNILSGFCSELASDHAIAAFSEDTQVTLHFNVHDLGLEFFLTLNNGVVDSSMGAPEHGAEVQLQMRAETIDGMFTGSIDAMECAMNGEISFMGDAAKAMTLQHMRSDMERLYTCVRESIGSPGDLSAIPAPGNSAPPTGTSGTQDIRQDLVNIMQELYATQVITATGGNISVRVPDTDDEVWITPSRLFKGDMKPESMVRINLAGEPLDTGARSPSSEWGFHTRVLEVKPEATAVIHAHAPNATILANTGLPFLPISSEAAFFGNIPRIPFTLPGTPELAEAVAGAIGDEWAVLLINHGLIVAGRSLRRAADMVEIIERSAEIILGCYAVGKEPPVLPEEAAAYYRQMGDVVA